MRRGKIKRDRVREREERERERGCGRDGGSARWMRRGKLIGI